MKLAIYGKLFELYMYIYIYLQSIELTLLQCGKNDFLKRKRKLPRTLENI